MNYEKKITLSKKELLELINDVVFLGFMAAKGGRKLNTAQMSFVLPDWILDELPKELKLFLESE